MASLMAKNTLDAKNKGGSPTAYKNKCRNTSSNQLFWIHASAWNYFWRVNGVRIGTAAEEWYVKFFWNIVGRWDLVIGWPAGDYLAGGRREKWLFQSEQAEALDKSSFHLADINGRVDAFAEIHHDIRSQDSVIARQTVHFDDGTRSTECEISERRSAVCSKIISDTWRSKII